METTDKGKAVISSPNKEKKSIMRMVPRL
jgi:hypothetical protein